MFFKSLSNALYFFSILCIGYGLFFNNPPRKGSGAGVFEAYAGHIVSGWAKLFFVLLGIVIGLVGIVISHYGW